MALCKVIEVWEICFLNLTNVPVAALDLAAGPDCTNYGKNGRLLGPVPRSYKFSKKATLFTSGYDQI